MTGIPVKRVTIAIELATLPAYQKLQDHTRPRTLRMRIEHAAASLRVHAHKIRFGVTAEEEVFAQELIRTARAHREAMRLYASGETD